MISLRFCAKMPGLTGSAFSDWKEAYFSVILELP
jgi:hypothetical protein